MTRRALTPDTDGIPMGWAMRSLRSRRSAALRAEPVALSQAKPAAAIAWRNRPRNARHLRLIARTDRFFAWRKTPNLSTLICLCVAAFAVTTFAASFIMGAAQ